MAVSEALPKLKKLGIPIVRHDDYFAEMVKTDDHMQKVGLVIIKYIPYILSYYLND